MVPHPINLKKENQENRPWSFRQGAFGYVVQKAPQVILIMKPVTNALEHDNTCKYKAM